MLQLHFSLLLLLVNGDRAVKDTQTWSTVGGVPDALHTDEHMQAAREHSFFLTPWLHVW